MTFMSVDLPDPDAPMIDTISPSPIVRSTDLSTCSRFLPVTYDLSRFSIRSMDPRIVLRTKSASDLGQRLVPGRREEASSFSSSAGSAGLTT